MNNGVTIWLVIFGLSAATFFIIAFVVSVKGIGDLRDLLRQSRRQEKADDFPGQRGEKFSE